MILQYLEQRRNRKSFGLTTDAPKKEQVINEKPVKEKRAMPKKSKKLKKDQGAHSRLKKKYLADHPFCECNRPECKGGEAIDVHHKAGRGKNLNNVETFLAVSRACHLWIEAHPQQSKELGLSKSRLKKSLPGVLTQEV